MLAAAVLVIVLAIAGAAIYLGQAGDEGGGRADGEQRQPIDLDDPYKLPYGPTKDERDQATQEREQAEVEARVECLEDGGKWLGSTCSRS